MTEEAKTDEENPAEEIGQEFIRGYLDDMIAITGGYDCLYRGQENEEWDLESGAERRLRKDLLGKSKDLPTKKRVPIDMMDGYHKELLSTSENLGFGIVDGRPLKELEILAKLQHFEAATALLDFTRNPLVALYFACQGSLEANGCLLVLPREPLTKVQGDAKIETILKSDKVNIWIPIVHGTAERRIIRQHSIFIIDSAGRLREEYFCSKVKKNGSQKNEAEKIPTKLKSIPIKAGNKEKILKALKKYHQISAETLFIDLQGFAANNAASKPFERPIIFLHRGVFAFSEGRVEEAIEAFDEAIRLKPDYAFAYYNRGVAKGRKEDYDGIVADFSDAIRFNPDFLAAYYNRGLAMSLLLTQSKQADVKIKAFSAALEDFKETLKLAIAQNMDVESIDIIKEKIKKCEAALSQQALDRLKDD